MTSQTAQDIDAFHAELDARNALIDEFRATSDWQVDERIRICRELSKYFAQRSDWQRRHCRSYNWATSNGVIPKLVGKGLRNGKPALFGRVSDLHRIARARDELHDFAMLNRFGYEQEYFAGEVLKQQIHAGNTIDASLELAKVALQTGMAEVKAAA
jgi:hypothetical protein